MVLFMVLFMVWFMVWFMIWFMVDGVLHIVLLEHGGLPCIFPLNVHLDLDFGHHCDTQWCLRLISEPCNPTQTI